MSKKRADRTGPSDLGARTRRLREARGWPQELLAAKAQISLASVSRIENDRGADVDSIFRIAGALGVRVGVLLDGTDETGLSAEQIAMLDGLNRLTNEERTRLLALVEVMTRGRTEADRE